jgi:hypothetical protein
MIERVIAPRRGDAAQAFLVGKSRDSSALRTAGLGIVTNGG